MYRTITYCFFAILPLILIARDHPGVGRPLDIAPVFAGNFGELRPNHFHSGLDFKTQGKTGLTIRSIDNGYVARATVSPWGFGRAIYVVHPSTGLTSVYGHLEAFAPRIDKIVRERQYSGETFNIDIEFKPGEIEVERGEFIALSGNAGSSGGPHLHMDIRDTETGDALDPMEFYRDAVNDKTPPEVRHIGLYPVRRNGIVNGTDKGAVLTKADAAKGFTAWGEVSPAINAFDRMTGTGNIYGVKNLVLTVDGVEVYRRTIGRFSFGTTKAVNTLAYYPDVVNRGRWMMMTYVPPSEPLDYMITASNNGVIDINEERTYRMEWILEDEMGNTARQPFTVRGKRGAIPETSERGSLLNFDGTHSYNNNGLRVVIPKGALYDDMIFRVVLSDAPSAAYRSKIASIGNPGVALASDIRITVPLENDDLADKSKYCLVRLAGEKRSAVPAKYVGGTLQASVGRFGKYGVTVDTVAPKIVPLMPEKWRNGTVAFRISDNLSGIETFRGEIDGKFALFELDGKTARVSFKMDPERFSRNIDHRVTMTVTDACGNRSEVSRNFHW